MKLRSSEHEEQKTYFQWVAVRRNQDPRYNNILAIPNQGTAGGKKWGAFRKSEGLAKGFPDIAMLVSSRGFHAAFMELKKPPKQASRLRKEQREWIERLKKQGYYADVFWGAGELIEFTTWYLEDG